MRLGDVGLVAFVVALAIVPAKGADMPLTLRIASVQLSVSGDLAENLERILRGIAEAKEAGARVVLFPETALSGFDSQTIATLDGDAVARAMARVAEAAGRHEVYVIYGCATPSGQERPYNSAIVVGPDGREVTRYHKMVPEDWFAPGDHLALFELDGVPCTMIVCHDNRYPELVRLPAIAGAQICFYISYEVNSLASSLRKLENYRAQLIARAAENGIWVVQSNGIGSPPGGSDRVVLGYSRFVDPGGVVVAEAPGMVDTMLVHDVDPARATRGNASKSLSIGLLRDWWAAGLERMYAADAVAAASAAPAPEKNTARLALMQAVPEKWNLEANFDVFLRLLAQADRKGAQIFVTPECWLDGYASPDKESTVERLREVAQELETSPYLRRVAAEARKRSMYICFGFVSLEDDRLYNAAGLWNSEGELVGVYHKTHLQTHDLQFSPGRALPVWPSPWGPLGIAICADRRWPETMRTLRLKGARLILLPTYGMHHEANEWWMRTRGYENQCFVAFAHPQVGLVVDPKGNIAGKRDDPSPGVLICDVDLALAKDDNHLRDRRPELYQVLTVPR